jgi:hypothetical protein
VCWWICLSSLGPFALFFTAAIPAQPQTTARPAAESSASALFQNLSARPDHIRAKQPTQVLVSVRVDHPSQIPGSGNVVRIDPDGRQTIVGTLHDDGQDGDAESTQPAFF